MLKLHLGVVELPYRSVTKKSGALTTGDVAQILESKYGVMGTFYKVHERDVVSAIEASMKGALEAKIMGAPDIDPWGAGMQQIQADFRDFILSREAERVGIPGTPTKAAQMGVNHRLKHPYRKGNPPRPSFRDTGSYVQSFRSWVTDGVRRLSNIVK